MTETNLKITGLDCLDCARGLEASVAAAPGVETVELHFFDGSLTVRGAVDEGQLRKLVTQLGYGVDDGTSASLPPAAEANALVGFWRYMLQQIEAKLALIAGVIILLSLAVNRLGAPGWTVIALQIGALILAGWPIARSGLVHLWVNRSFNINFLMTVAGIGAVAIGEYAEAASMILLFSIAEALEGFTNERARGAIAQLKELTPTHALKLADGQEQLVPVEKLSPGDTILVSPGERIPIDGVVLEGNSDVDQATITGESIPVWKAPGDDVFSGTVNGSGKLVIQVTRLVGDSSLHRIIELVTQAQSRQSQSQKFIDLFAHYYTPAMVLLALLVAIIPPVVLGAPFLNPADGSRGWLYRALALLIISCPCALVISTPVTMAAGLTRAARAGVLFKGSIFLEALSKLRTFAFDKTGTLTRGEPQVVDSKDLDCLGGVNCEPCNDMIALAYALERHSTHPLAQAITREAEQRGLTECYPAAENLVARGGMGLEGLINDHLMTIGSRRLFAEEHIVPSQVDTWVDQAEAEGKTAMLLCDGQRVRGFIAVADTLRKESASVITELKGMGKKTILLTGDNRVVANKVGGDIGIDEVRASLLPGDKQQIVEILRQDYGPIAMVGDGINDAPALAAANLGIAMGGSGSAQAMETADVVLMADDLHKLPFAIRLSAFANRLIRQNISFSLGSKLLVAVLALFGFTPLWLAVLADMGVSLLVTLNGLRALRFEREKGGARNW
ncbi:MAG: cation-translocating P-type ATPase [Porticoccaceae bacterium]|nr:cation-translocating P-type ATPase [Porticoccaceae bacterium]